MTGLVPDRYTLQARWIPAIAFISVPILLLMAWFAELRGLWTVAPFATVGLAAAAMLGSWVGKKGKSVEAILFRKWEGVPTTALLRHTDATLDRATKARYHHILETNCAGFRSASLEEEMAAPSSADDQYSSGVRWLQAQIRDRKTAPLVHEANISYGFARNLFGVRCAALGLASVSIAASLMVLAIGYWSECRAGPVEALVSTASGLAVLLCWVYMVDEASVKRAGVAYAKALLEVLDKLPRSLP